MDSSGIMQKLGSRPFQRKVLRRLLVALTVYGLIGFFVLPPIVKSILTKKLAEQFHRDVAIQKIKVNPFMLSVSVKGFRMKERNGTGTFLSFDELYLNLQSLSLVKKGVILREIRLEHPYVHLVRNEDLSYNFSDMLVKTGEGKKTTTGPLLFSLNNIQLYHGSVEFVDMPKKKKHEARDILVTIPFLSDLAYYEETFVKPAFSAIINGRQFSLEGETKPFADSLETSVDVTLTDVDIPYYLAYLPFEQNFTMPSGRLDLALTVLFVQSKGRPPTVNIKGRVALKQITVADRAANPVVSLPRLDVSIASTDLLEGKIDLSRVALQSPELTLERDGAERLNILKLLPERREEGEKPAAGKKSGRSLVLRAGEISLTKGKVMFTDRSRQGPFHTELTDITVKIDHFSTARDEKSAVGMSLKTESDETASARGEFSLAPLASEGAIELKGLVLKKYSPYYAEKILFDLVDGGLSVSTSYAFSGEQGIEGLKLSGLAADLVSLKLRKRGERDDFLRLPSVRVEDTEVDFSKRDVAVGLFKIEGADAAVVRLRDGSLNVSTLTPPPAAADGSLPKTEKPGRPWTAMMKKMDVSKTRVSVEDLTTADPVRVAATDIRFSGEDISTAPGRQGKAALTLRIGKRGSVSASGTVGISPVLLKLKMKIRDLDITPYQPYFTDRVKIIITSGGISSNGALSLTYGKEGGLKTDYRGDLSLTGFASVDKANAEDFLKWKSLYFGGVDVRYAPLRVLIDQIALSDFYSRIIINKDGTINLQDIIEKKAEARASARTGAGVGREEGPGAKLIKISAVTLQGGDINFSDHHIKPPYSADLREIGGRISGLSSEQDRMADVDLRGKLGDYAPLEITGKINPLREDLFVDLKANFTGMDLSTLSAYSGRYAGYTIQKGQLSLNVKYLIVKKKLDSENNIFLDQFTFGERVESPQATKLPVKFAVALLKNRKGEINLDIPVTGQIDDPKFSIGKVVVKIIVNLLVKAATSPFALLGAIFGGGGNQDLGYVDFDYGRSIVPEGGLQKLETLSKALYDRPALKLDIEGHVDLEKDREALRQIIFDRKIKAQKLKDLVRKGEQPASVDEVRIAPEEYLKYLKLAYKAGKFPKPRNFFGIVKDLPPAEMEKLMLTHIEVTDNDLRQLAMERAQRIKDHLLKSGKVEPDRVFVIESQSLAPEKKEKLKDSRVDFKLK